MHAWFDLDNSPHVPLFLPVIEELLHTGNQVTVTSRDYAQTLDLLRKSGIPFKEVGRYGGKNKLTKILTLLERAYLLKRTVQPQRPDVAVSHGSRAQALTAKWLGIPKILFFDYEGTEMQIFKRASKILSCPRAIPDAALISAGLPLSKVIRYEGFKEDLYLSNLIPDPHFLSSLGVPPEMKLVVLRPPSLTSNYHDNKSEALMDALVKKLAQDPTVFLYVSARTQEDESLVTRLIRDHRLSHFKVTRKSVNGLQLLYWADLVVSGGGTMNREAALLGTPVFSIFSGKRPALDEYLQSEGKLKFITSPEDLKDLRVLKRAPEDRRLQNASKHLHKEFCRLIKQTAEQSL